MYVARRRGGDEREGVAYCETGAGKAVSGLDRYWLVVAEG